MKHPHFMVPNIRFPLQKHGFFEVFGRTGEGIINWSPCWIQLIHHFQPVSALSPASAGDSGLPKRLRLVTSYKRPGRPLSHCPVLRPEDVKPPQIPHGDYVDVERIGIGQNHNSLEVSAKMQQPTALSLGRFVQFFQPFSMGQTLSWQNRNFGEFKPETRDKSLEVCGLDYGSTKRLHGKKECALPTTCTVAAKKYHSTSSSMTQQGVCSH